LVLTVAGILYGLYRYRIGHLLRIQRVRNSISADLHDELGSSLSGISIMGILAKQNIPEDHPSTPFITRILEETHQISGSLDDIVWSIGSNNDTLGSTIARMTRYAAELFEAKQIKYRFTLPENMEGIRLSMEHRRNLYLIFKESTNNLVKYSRCTLASVHIQVVNKTFSLTLTDNGVGFDPAIQNDRNGIRNMKDRTARLHGELVVESIAGEGTTIHLTFPMRD
jgi:signal transduction histidine kinase